MDQTWTSRFIVCLTVQIGVDGCVPGHFMAFVQRNASLILLLGQDFVHTLCDQLLHGDLIPSDREHFAEVAAEPGAGPGPGHTSETAALRLGHSGKLLHGFAFFCRRMQSPFSGTLTTIYRVA